MLVSSCWSDGHGFSHMLEHKFRHNFEDAVNPLCSFILKQVLIIFCAATTSLSVVQPFWMIRWTFSVRPNCSCVIVCVSWGKKCLFFGKFDVLCFLETSVLRFVFLPYYQRTCLFIRNLPQRRFDATFIHVLNLKLFSFITENAFVKRIIKQHLFF